MSYHVLGECVSSKIHKSADSKNERVSRNKSCPSIVFKLSVLSEKRMRMPTNNLLFFRLVNFQKNVA